MAAQRHVRRLRLACSREEEATHGRVLLEDALRTASLGDEGRLVFVRRLELGKISARSPATHWSRRVEESYRNLRTRPAHVRQDGAERAAAVYFSSAHEPWLVLAERLARGVPCGEWYWRLAIPGWRPSVSPREWLRRSFQQLAAGGLGLTLELGVRLAAHSALSPLLDAITEEDLHPLTAALGYSVASAEVESASTPAGTPRRGEIDDKSGGPQPSRTAYWLAAVALAQRQSGTSGAISSVAPSATEIRAQVMQRRKWAKSSTTSELVSDREASRGKPPEIQGAPDQETSAMASEARENSSPKIPPAREEPEFTQAGGLFFLVPLLARVGLPEFISSLPEEARANLPWQVLRVALRHARIVETDALRRQLATLPTPTVRLGRWLIAANRLALRRTGINLRDMVRRPALVQMTATHVDVFFRANEADVRLRRVGLDLDLGWVPWLGRIVSFHFNRED